MRLEINHDNLNQSLSAIFTMAIEKMSCIHNILVKNKNLV